jgi:hypothetical protein
VAAELLLHSLVDPTTRKGYPLIGQTSPKYHTKLLPNICCMTNENAQTSEEIVFLGVVLGIFTCSLHVSQVIDDFPVTVRETTPRTRRIEEE